MATQPLPLSILCDVSVMVSPLGAAVPALNQGLIVGDSAVIPSQGANSRIRLYASVAAMISDGFDTSDPEVIAAGLYFGQSPAPVFLWVGCQDATAIATLILDPTHGGTGYAVGDIFLVTQGGASLGFGKVDAEAGGVVSACSVISGMQGTGYAIANGLTTVAQGTSGGAGLEVNITAIGETPLQAITACRLAQPAWYVAMCTTAVDADDVAIAAFAQTATPQMQYLYSTASASALNGTSGNVFSLIKAASYGRVLGIYSTTQSGGAPNNAYFAAAIMGVAMGLNTGLANSNFTLAGKKPVGVIVEPISLSQLNVFAGTPGVGTGNNGNAFVNYGDTYDVFGQGVNGNGSWFDQVLGLDMLAVDAQLSVLNIFTSLPSIPQDNAGQSLVLNAIAAAAARSAARGFLAGGTWTGPTVLGLTAGTSLPSGYLVQSASFATQSPTDRALRKGMPAYLTVILAGSQQSFTIGIFVQQ